MRVLAWLRVPLFLLDTDLPENQAWDRELSARLYGGDRETRIQQEIILGVGGVRALKALGLPVIATDGTGAYLQREALLPTDPDDERAAFLEIRAGTGGSEAAIFAADLYRMYNRYAEAAGLKIEDLESSPSELGGLKEVIFKVSGESVFRTLRYESGVHRVQRGAAVPSAGDGGRARRRGVQT